MDNKEFQAFMNENKEKAYRIGKQNLEEAFEEMQLMHEGKIPKYIGWRKIFEDEQEEDKKSEDK